jgi:hypothetical protein
MMIPKMWSDTERAAESSQRWERFERKFFVSPERADYARSLLSHLCLPDGVFPQGRINSLYFDTPDLDHFQKSDDGSYEREKIRIRWYDSPANWEGMVPVYLELKAKRGFASRKQRRKIFVTAEKLKRIRGNNTIVNRSVILQTLSEFGYFSKEPLVPVILVTYERFRFVEILTGARLSFDRRISSVTTAPGLGYGQSSLMLKGAVIEIKGPSMEIPRSLCSLIELGADWTRFSKYAGCLEGKLSHFC